MPLPPLLQVPEIHQRLQTIFPGGTANRNYVTREIAAKTVFVTLYIGAVEGAERWIRSRVKRPAPVWRVRRRPALPSRSG